MRNYTPAQYKKAAVIPPYTNLHLPVIIIDNNKGRSSIQINGLQKLLGSKPYNCLKSFAGAYSVEYDKKDRVLKISELFYNYVMFIGRIR